MYMKRKFLIKYMLSTHNLVITVTDVTLGTGETRRSWFWVLDRDFSQFHWAETDVLPLESAEISPPYTCHGRMFHGKVYTSYI